MQQEHQVLLAARLEEGYHFLILLDSSHNFTLVQGPAAVLVDQLEALARGVFEVERELLDFFLRRLGLHLALGRAVRELVRQRDLDGLLPFAFIDVAVAVRVHLLERRLETRRDEEVLEVRVAAVDEELDDALVALDGRDDLRLFCLLYTS